MPIELPQTNRPTFVEKHMESRFYALQHPIRNTFARIEYNVHGIKLYLEIFTMQLEIH